MYSHTATQTPPKQGGEDEAQNEASHDENDVLGCDVFCCKSNGDDNEGHDVDCQKDTEGNIHSVPVHGDRQAVMAAGIEVLELVQRSLAMEAERDKYDDCGECK